LKTEKGGKKYPFLWLHIQAPPSEFDVNYLPSKRKLVFHKEEMLLKTVDDLLTSSGIVPKDRQALLTHAHTQRKLTGIH
jgi:DNA mismatch repair ATPase MutL